MDCIGPAVHNTQFTPRSATILPAVHQIKFGRDTCRGYKNIKWAHSSVRRTHDTVCTVILPT